MSVLRAGICGMGLVAVGVVDAQTVSTPLSAVPEAAPLAVSRPADPANGQRIVVDRRRGMCLLCHAGPFPEERFQGDLAPSLAGAGSRWNAGQLRFRLMESRTLNANSIMPSYFRVEGKLRVARAYEGRTILSAQEIEDVTAFLVTLRD